MAGFILFDNNFIIPPCELSPTLHYLPTNKTLDIFYTKRIQYPTHHIQQHQCYATEPQPIRSATKNKQQKLELIQYPLQQRAVTDQLQ